LDEGLGSADTFLREPVPVGCWVEDQDQGDEMSDDSTIRKEVKLAYRNGLHLTPIQKLVKQSTGVQRDIRVLFVGKSANDKSAMDLLLLGATFGSLLTIEATGSDATEAVDVAVEVLATEQEVEGPA